MGKNDRVLPPGPNPREDQMRERHQKELRKLMQEGRELSEEEKELIEKEVREKEEKH